ncbi:hypothetical protein [Bdellovibrio reynosensis]|uniref:Uncharacterized protein n=1 Tax=Bdellovibrio reynosensis TaxID=2835041 RepID=A0ABY4C5M6_9BACT|nr:hypothetical protein [Bdellovibrio reynosensis]UOF00180.1 hypothetical protein MNR06_10750 [Bdellovibrio reynosensis]
MKDVFITVFLLVCAVEAFFIFKEASRMRGESKLAKLLKAAQADVAKLKDLLSASENALDSAKKEVQGIYVLWNRSIESEQKMRKELDIAKTQLTYLAKKVVRKDGPQQESAEPHGKAPTYWNLSQGQSFEEKPVMKKQNLSEIHQSIL